MLNPVGVIRILVSIRKFKEFWISKNKYESYMWMLIGVKLSPMYLDNTQCSNLVGVTTWLSFGIDSPKLTSEK